MKNTILFLFGLLLHSQAWAQPKDMVYPADVWQVMQEAAKADFVLEGTVTGLSASFRDSLFPEGYQYRVATVKIHRVFKGQLSCGSIEVLCKGKVGPGGGFNGKHGDANLMLDQSLTLFLRKDLGDYQSPTLPIRSNNMYRTRLDFGFGYEISASGIWVHSYFPYVFKREFPTYKDFDHFIDSCFQQAPKVCEPLQVPSPPPIEHYEPGPRPETDSSMMRRKQQRIDSLQRLHPGLPRRGQAPGKGKRNSGIGLQYQVANKTLTADATGTIHYLEFDLQVSPLGIPSYLRQFIVSISYNASLFGINMVANDKIWITVDPYFWLPGSGANLEGLNDYQQQNNKLEYYLVYAGGRNLPVMPGNALRLIHVKMQMGSGCNLSSGVQVELKNAEYQETEYLQHLNDPDESYNIVSAAQSVSYLSCQPSISSMSSAGPGGAWVGGRGDVLTINGISFGNSRGNGAVKFRDANNPASTAFYKIGADDYLVSEWSDSRIRIKIPSTLFNTGAPDNPVAGLQMLVENDAGLSTEIKTVNIQYSIINQLDNNNKKVPLYPAGRNGSGGYSLVLSPDLYANAEALRCLVAAMKYWSCQCGVNWNLGPSYSIGNPGADGVCYIYTGSTPSGVGAKTDVTATCPAADYAIKEFDIKLSNTAPWVYRLPGEPYSGSTYDFYAVILHELGHALGLEHIGNTQDIMYFEVSQTPASYRRLEAQPAYSMEGGLRQVNYPVNYSACIGASIQGPMLPMAYDLSMKDGSKDAGLEPNHEDFISSSQVWNIWNSPDIWNQVQQGAPPIHTDAEYLGAGVPNYVFFRVRNNNCSSSTPATLRLYWTIASTGEKWKEDWDGSTLINNLPAGGEILTAGLPVSIPALSPGQIYRSSVAWYPPRPQNYISGQTQMPVCLLGRIETHSAGDYGMMFKEQLGPLSTFYNVLRNNNISTRNLLVSNLGNLKKASGWKPILLSNTLSSAATFDLVFSTDFDEVSHNYWAAGTASLRLGETLFSNWVASGASGSGITADAASFSIRLNGPGARINNIALAAGQMSFVEMQFQLHDSLNSFNNDSFFFGLLQHRQGTEPGTDEGAVMFRVDVEANDAGAAQAAHAEPAWSIFPNVVQDILVLRSSEELPVQPVFEVYDALGRKLLQEKFTGTLFRQYGLRVETLTPGVYFVRILSGSSSKTFRFIKR